MIRPPPSSNRTEPPLPYTPLCRSPPAAVHVSLAVLPTLPRAFAVSVSSSASSIWPSSRSSSAKPSTRSEEHTSELQALMRISYAVVCLQKIKGQPYSKRPRQNDNHQRPSIRTNYD